MSGSKLPLKENFSEWYHELLKLAEIIDIRYPIKGMFVWQPFGFALRKNVYSIIRELLDVDHSETLFPLLIPEYEFMKEAEHIKGFEDEVYWVTHGGRDSLDIKLALRPTSETAIYPIFKLWIRSHADLPLRVYQIVNTFRYETKHTRPLIRVREITSFKEAHTAHATWEEARDQVATAIQRYSEFYHRLAIPYLIVRRPDWDKFPGADYTIALDTVMPDGRTLQIGTAHHLSSNFAKTFGITYENPEGEQVLVNQTCYGISERCIAALISVHGDDTGLILPWAVAPLQVVVVPIIFAEKERVLELCRSYQKRISDAGIRVRLDESDDRPGAKFYRWELSGVPIRIEVGPRDMERGAVTLVRRDGRKIAVPKDELIAAILAEANDLQLVLAEKAKKFMESLIRDCYTVDEARDQIRVGIAKVAWCGSEDCGHKLEDEIGASILGVPEGSNEDCKSAGGSCIICGMDTGICAFMARQY